MEETLITTGIAAERLGVSRQHVVDLCERGDLPFTRIGTHRRILSGDIERLTHPLTPDEERSVWLHEAVLGQLVVNPERVVKIAERNLARWQGVHRSDGRSAHYLRQWEEVLKLGINEIRRTLIGTDQRAINLRQNSPFSGVLTEDQRKKVLHNFTHRLTSV